jgi:hypothetical protein
VFGMAIKLNDTSSRQAWALFMRNWGDEGGCSQDQHYTPSNDLSFFFGNEGGPNLTIDESHTNMRIANGPGQWGATNFSDGMVVTFHLPDPGNRSLFFGELQLCKGPCVGGTLDLKVALPNAGRPAQPGAAAPEIDSEKEDAEIDEASIANLAMVLTPAQMQQMVSILGQQRLRLAALLTRQTAQASRNDGLVVSRHHQLTPGEPRVIVPGTTMTDPAHGTRGASVFQALSTVLGGDDAANAALKKLPGPAH